MSPHVSVRTNHAGGGRLTAAAAAATSDAVTPGVIGPVRRWGGNGQQWGGWVGNLGRHHNSSTAVRCIHEQQCVTTSINDQCVTTSINDQGVTTQGAQQSTTAMPPNSPPPQPLYGMADEQWQTYTVMCYVSPHLHC
jgi:hypothetical protein